MAGKEGAPQQKGFVERAATVSKGVDAVTITYGALIGSVGLVILGLGSWYLTDRIVQPFKRRGQAVQAT